MAAVLALIGVLTWGTAVAPPGTAAPPRAETSQALPEEGSVAIGWSAVITTTSNVRARRLSMVAPDGSRQTVGMVPPGTKLIDVRRDGRAVITRKSTSPDRPAVYQIWDVAAQTSSEFAPLTGGSLAFGPGASLLLCESGTNRVTLRSSTGAYQRTIPIPGCGSNLVSPDGELFVTEYQGADHYGRMDFYRVPSGQQVSSGDPVAPSVDCDMQGMWTSDSIRIACYDLTGNSRVYRVSVSTGEVIELEPGRNGPTWPSRPNPWPCRSTGMLSG